MTKQCTCIITSLRCQVQPYTDCQLSSEQQEYEETELVAKEFQEKECEQGRKEIPHQVGFRPSNVQIIHGLTPAEAAARVP